MLWTFITQAKAIDILHDTLKTRHRDLEVPYALHLCWTVGLNLATEAILIRKPDGWQIYGYAYDGRDVLPYVRDCGGLRITPYPKAVMTQAAFELKRLDFEWPNAYDILNRAEQQTHTQPIPALPEVVEDAPALSLCEPTALPINQPPRRVTYRLRPARNRPGWTREVVIS